MQITDTHANGLARHDLRQLRARCREASDGAFRKLEETNVVTTGKGARRLITRIGRNFEATAWARRAHSDRRGTYAAWLVPIIGEDDLAVCCVSLRMPRGEGVHLRQWPWLIVPKHAIARGHQRLQNSDWAAVQGELRAVALQSAAVQFISMANNLKQFAIPANHGLLIGDVGEVCLRAKTFIAPPLSRRWSAVLDAWLRFEQHLPAVLSNAFEELALDHDTPRLTEALSLLTAELTAFDFLRQLHDAREDPIGELWDRARTQQASQSP